MSVVDSESGSEGDAFALRNSRWIQLRTRGMLLASMDASWNAEGVDEFSVIVTDSEVIQISPASLPSFSIAFTSADFHRGTAFMVQSQEMILAIPTFCIH